MDKQKFKEFLTRKVSEHWEKSQNALLLSDIPSLLKQENQKDYRDVLGDQRLKGFAEENQGEDAFKVVIHPTQKAKVGLVPWAEDFSFPEEENRLIYKYTPEDRSGQSSLPIKSRRVTLEFLDILTDLSEEDQRQVCIPVHILGKLLHKK